MNYYDDMRRKGGFNDGDSVPPGVRDYREVYITALNVLAVELGSRIRAVAFDRSGMHNWCFILFERIEDFEKRYDKGLDGTRDVTVDEIQIDSPMQVAIELARELNLDMLVHVTVKTLVNRRGLKRSLRTPVVQEFIREHIDRSHEGRHVGGLAGLRTKERA